VRTSIIAGIAVIIVHGYIHFCHFITPFDILILDAIVDIVIGVYVRE